MIPGSYANGFAPRDAEPLYPQLWRGCVGAWCPSLGPTGGTLRDWSGRQNHGTLSAGTTLANTWKNDGMLFDGTDDYVDCGTYTAIDGASQLTMSAWFRRSSVGAYVSFGKRTGLSDAMEVSAYTDGVIYFTAFNGSISYGSVEHNDASWHHVSYVFDGSLSGNAKLKASIDGIEKTLTYVGTLPSALSSSPGNFLMGRSTTIGYSSGMIDDVIIHLRPLPLQEIRLLASGRGIAYTPRIVSRSRAATGNRRRRIFFTGAA